MALSSACGRPEARTIVVRSDSAGVEILTFSSVNRLVDMARWLPMAKTRVIPTTVENTASRPLVFDPRSMLLMPNGDLVVSDMAGPPIVLIPPGDTAPPHRFSSIGQGPGELWGGIPLLWSEDDSLLAVADRGNERVTVFDISGASADTAMSDSLIVLEPPYNRWSPATAMERHRVSRLGKETMWLPRALWTVLPGGRIVVGSTDSGVLEILDASGRVLKELKLPLSPRPVTEEDRRLVTSVDSLSKTSQSTRHWEFPDVMPITDKLLAFDDTTVAMRQTWVSNPAGPHAVGQRSIAWRLITVNGTLRGIIMFGPGFEPRWTDGRRVLGVQRDSLDVATLVEYQIGTVPSDQIAHYGERGFITNG